MSRRILIFLLVFAVLGMGGCKRAQEEMAAAQNPYPKASPLHLPFDRMVRKMFNDPRYLAMIKQGDKAQRQRIGFELSQQGIARLDRATLERRLEILADISDSADITACALLARGGDASNPQPATTAMLRGLEKLPQAQIDDWFDISFKATEAQLSSTPPQAVSEADSEAAMAALLVSLPEHQQRRLLQVLPAIAHASDDDACWAARTLYRRALGMRQPARGQLAWLFAQQ